MFGGNSNWRGPIWMPVNALIIRALLQYYAYYGDDFTVECPTGSGRQMTLYQVAEEICAPAGAHLPAGRRRPPAGLRRHATSSRTIRTGAICILFYEYFHGDNGAGLGASHQTGWTGIVARLMHLFATTLPRPDALDRTARAAVREPASRSLPPRRGSQRRPGERRRPWRATSRRGARSARADLGDPVRADHGADLHRHAQRGQRRHGEIRTLLIGAIGCNIAWGLVDAVMYLVSALTERGRDLVTVRAVRDAAEPVGAHHVIAGAVTPIDGRHPDRRRHRAAPPAPAASLRTVPRRPALTRDDWLGGPRRLPAGRPLDLPAGRSLPAVIDDARRAIRTSHATAIVLLFVSGVMLARFGGYRPLLTGLSMVVLGVVLVTIAIALGRLTSRRSVMKGACSVLLPFTADVALRLSRRGLRGAAGVVALTLAGPVPARGPAPRRCRRPARPRAARRPSRRNPGGRAGRSTPRGTVLGFLGAARRREPDVAAQYLNTRATGEDAEALAHQLFVVLDARLPARLSQVSDERDGSSLRPRRLPSRASARSSDAGDVEIVLERVTRDKGPVWLFSRKTLAAIPAVYEEVERDRSASLLPGPLGTTRVGGIRLVEWVALLFGFAILYLLTVLLNRLLTPLVARLWQRPLHGSRLRDGASCRSRRGC